MAKIRRKIIQIDESKCNGCGICIDACHEGALQLVDGKAKLVSESYCDGLGDCLPECPLDAIKIVEREADAFDEEAVKKAMAAKKAAAEAKPLACGCPGTNLKKFDRKPQHLDAAQARHEPAGMPQGYGMQSQLGQWPCQIKLVPVNAPYFDNAHLLVAADCTAFAYANIHNDFMRNKITIIGCPKLDAVDYSDKLTAILQENNIKSITVLRMEVPCCGGIEHAVINALRNSGKMIPWSVVTITTDGLILED